MLQLGEKVEEMKRQRKSLIDKVHEEFQLVSTFIFIVLHLELVR